METITTGKFVELVYDLYEVAGHSEILMFKFTDEQPDRFVFGLEQGMLESFKKGIEGLKVDEEFEIKLTPEQAFGEIRQDLIMEFKREMFEVDGKFDSERIIPGNVIEMMAENGQRVPGHILEVTDKTVKIDFNHPLAGQNLRFKGKVKTVRDATPEELQPKSCCSGCSCGHDHDHDEECGCGCGDDCCSGCH